MTPFSEHLRYHRERAGLSQNRLAIATGMTHGTLSRLEAGTRHPRRETVDALAEALSLGPTEADRLRLAAGFSPNDLVGLVVDACGHVIDGKNGLTELGTVAHKSAVYLRHTSRLLKDDGRDLNTICREVPS